MQTIVYSAVGINDGGTSEYTDLTTSRHLTQSQLDSMFGDSSTKIPEHLERPVHWLDVVFGGEDKDTQKDVVKEITQSPFAFLSYAAENRAVITALSGLFDQSNIDTWWDQDIDGGQAWRDAIDQKLDAASAVVTFWTAASVGSKPVREEASRAQKANKLIPVRLDDAPVPFGFEETQWIDLRQWDGTASDANFRKLIQAVQDKISPPTKEDLEQRHRAASPIGAKNKGGKVGLYDTPLNTAARVQNDEDLAARLAGLWSSIDRVEHEISDHTAYQLPPEARRRLTALGAMRNDNPLTWYALKDATDALAECMERLGAEEQWNEGIYVDFRRIIARVGELQDLMQPEQIPAGSPGAKPPETEPVVGHEQVPDAQEIAQGIAEELATDAAEDALDPTAISTILRDINTIDEAAESLPAPEGQASRFQAIRRGVKRLVYAVGAVVGVVTGGVIVQLLTAPEAATTLASRLQPLLDRLLAFFM